MKKTVKFELEKVTKNTIRFREVVESPLDVPAVGVIYVPKTTLRDIGWSDGHLTMDLYVAK
jgi:hypothetical protein